MGDRQPGGDNSSLLNHWPQPLSSAREKDQLEAAVAAVVAKLVLSCSPQLCILVNPQW
jgi:hypothetical protein